MKMSISITKGKGSVNHNKRKFVTSNVDKDRIENDIILRDESIKEVYNKIFGEALEKYNAKQTRGDRMIKSYYEKVSRSKQEKPFYEMIIQFGNEGNTIEQNEIVVNILMDVFEMIDELYPNIYIFGAYIHNDEATPHIHIDYIPIGHSKNRGLEVKNSHNLAMKEMGFNDYSAWREDIMSNVVAIAKEYDVERLIMHNENKHLSVKEYKEVVHSIEKAQDYHNSLLKDNEILKKQIQDKEETISKLDKQIYEKESYEPFWYRIFAKIIMWLNLKFDIELPFLDYEKNEIHEDILDDEIDSLSKYQDDFDYEM